ncbi:2-haloacid dehalogenase [Novosphingobium hassiacum]|uniref:(S)-2-haloacid dehalogenase n=1 Tax=Novosphingobium hassiacum TaxID=173676 RepID=A0A7W5ZWK0_9SPHN|nr:2-haloacid dehalogenase [Novosphingobium hassiacum]
MGHSPSSMISRRYVVGGLAAGAMLSPAMSRAAANAQGPVEAIAFDGFPIFDPRSVGAMVKSLVPDRGEALAQAWSTKLFGYTWLYTSADRYAPFDAVADEALRFSADALALTLSAAVRERLVGAYAQLDVWPDVKPALEKLNAAGVRLAFLSNLGEDALRANMARNGIAPAFAHVLSTDRVRKFKPAPAAYAMAMKAFDLPKERIGFAAFGGWDAAGAAWFGYRTAWVNRLGVPREPIQPGPSIVAPGMAAVLALAGLT